MNPGGETEIRVWAPNAKKVELAVEKAETIALAAEGYGYWNAVCSTIKAGDNYWVVFDDGKKLPDPASLYQPAGVHGPSQVVDIQEFDWNDSSWQNLPLEDYIFYELHTGTFSPEGDFEGIIKKLDYLAELGISAIELMPAAQFPGGRNWGYDGVFPFAVQNSYGGPQGLQRLVDACHQKGLAVVLDVVYNHLGPEGNYLSSFGPYFTSKYQTPWGDAVNFDDAWCDGVRHYFISNALMWFRDFHIDALRLDAVHAIKDFSPRHILAEMQEQVSRLEAENGRRYYLVIECDLNDPRFIRPAGQCGYGIGAQWTDEFHHALRVTAGELRRGYYSDFTGIEDLAIAYRDGYVYTGQYSAHRHKKFGMPAANPGSQFVVFSQNHDQTGNRMLGERTSVLASFGMRKLMAAAVLLSPFLPLLFMGEEWSAQTPFLYFVSHSDEQLINAVREGRKKEFEAFHQERDTPDPQAEDTFYRSKLNWSEPYSGANQTMLRYYKELIRLRKSHPALNSCDRQNTAVEFSRSDCTLVLRRNCATSEVLCLMNFSDKRRLITVKDIGPVPRLLLDSSAPDWGGVEGVAATRTVAGGFVIASESITVYEYRHV